ncbi:MAG: RsbRD N-terminal domain-containing protein [Acidobacteriota bacterium]
MDIKVLLAKKKNAIVKQWLDRTLQAYPIQTSRFLMEEKDPFRNPVGQVFQDAFPRLFDELLAGMNTGRVAPILGDVVRIRAVQDVTAGQSIAFIFMLKKIIRKAVKESGDEQFASEELCAIESQIDDMALLAFDLFMHSREKTYEIKLSEAKRRLYLLERSRETASVGGGEDQDK